MNRRNVLKSGVAFAMASAIAGRPLVAHMGAGRRVRPSDPSWPKKEDWDALRREVGGNLIQPQPLLAACEQNPDGASCREAHSYLKNPYFIGDQPSGTQLSGWIGAWSPMTSAYAVACHTALDVAATVNFARRNNLRIAIKGGAHSYQGTSNAADSLLIWTRAMNAIQLHQNFIAKDCHGCQAPSPAVTVEAGAVWMDVYDAVMTKAGRYVQGGGCATVGVAGLIQSGGFGTFSKSFGSAASSLLQADIVTADGRHRTVNQVRDPELFWGIKGGGGGSLGVVTNVTLRTYPLPDFLGGADGEIQASSDESFRRLIGRFIDLYRSALFNPHWGESVSIAPNNTLKISMSCADLDDSAARQVWAPFYNWVSSAPSDFNVTDELWAGSPRPARDRWNAPLWRSQGSTSMVFDDRAGASPTHAWWSGDQEQVGAFCHGYESVWLPQSLLREGQRALLANALFEASRHMGVSLHFNKGLAGAPPAALAAARDTAMNPAVIDSFALAIIATGGAPRYPGLPVSSPVNDAAATRNARAVDLSAQWLLKVAPLAGSYVSESNYFNSDWSHAFWGSNYPRLRAVKRKYDADGLFFVHHGVGSEEWSADGFSRL